MSEQKQRCGLCFGAGFIWQRRPHKGDEYAVPCPACEPFSVPFWLWELREQLRTQDNAATADPIFVVQQRVRDIGYDPGWTDDVAWVDDEGELDEEQAARCEAVYDETGATEVDGARRAGYKDRYEFVTACLTNEAAESYIAANKHRLCEPRVFVESGYRNYEWIRLRSWLMGEERGR